MTTITSTELGASGRYIDIGTPASQNNVGAQTILIYARAAVQGSQESNFPYFLGKTADNSINGMRVFIDFNTSDRGFTFGNGSTGQSTRPQRAASDASRFAGEWAHFAATYDGTINSSGIRLYGAADPDTIAELSYVAASALNGSGAVVDDSSRNLILMNRGSSSSLGRALVGDVAYIARWDRVLSLAELETAQSDGPLEVPTGLILLWANDQDYSTNDLTPTARSTRVEGATPPNTTLGPATDTTAPVLTLPTGTTTGATTADGTVTTDEANGTLYAVVTASATPPSAADIRAGTGAVYSTSQAVSSTGVQSVAATGLTAETTYYWHFLHDDAAANASNIVTSASFTTDAAGVVVKGVRVRLYDAAGDAAASITGIQAAWFDQPEPKDALAPVFKTSTASTEADGWLEIDLDSTTALAVAANGFLIAYKLDATDHQDSPVFAGRLTVEDIS